VILQFLGDLGQELAHFLDRPTKVASEERKGEALYITSVGDQNEDKGQIRTASLNNIDAINFANNLHFLILRPRSMWNLELLLLYIRKSSLPHPSSNFLGNVQLPPRHLGRLSCQNAPLLGERAVWQLSIQRCLGTEDRRDLDALKPTSGCKSVVGFGKVGVPVRNGAVNAARVNEIERAGRVKPGSREIVNLEGA
jgi:hypothetical protein